MSKKAIKTWEIECGAIFQSDEVDLEQKVTREEFYELMRTVPFIGVNYKDRVEYLKSKDIEVTRESLTNSDL